MKAILTLVLVLLFGAAAIAQTAEVEHKVKAFHKGVKIIKVDTPKNLEVPAQAVHLALVFKSRKSLIKNSLTFTTVNHRRRLV